MRVVNCRRVLFLMLCLIVHSGICKGGSECGYEFELNDNPYKPYIISLNGMSDSPSEGDVVIIKDMEMVLGPVGTYRYRLDEKSGQLMSIGSDGSSAVAAVSVDTRYEDDKKVYVNPLETMSDEEIRDLRGIQLHFWTKAVESKLQQVDREKVFICVYDGEGWQDDKKLPILPDGIFYLCVDSRSSNGVQNFSRLVHQKQLRFLDLNPCEKKPFDVSVIQATTLRYFRISGVELENTRSLSKLMSLRELDVSYIKHFEDIDFLKSLKELRVLRISMTGVKDLRVISDLPNLWLVEANLSRVSRLPDTSVGGLKRISLLSAPLAESDVKQFSKLNPQCEVDYHWETPLKRALEGVTRIRIRTGGTCHRRQELEKTLSEITDPKAVKAFVEKISIDDQKSDGYCMCCGSPSFEFYRDGKLVTTLGVHHGLSLRWPGGWPADGVMNEGFGDYLCQWLAEHGDPKPLQERQESKKQDDAMERLMALYQQILPASVAELLFSAESDEQAIRAFSEGEKDTVKRVCLYFRLFGCNDGAWDHYAGMEYFLQDKLMPQVSKADIEKALKAISSDPFEGRGAARWLFGERKWQTIDKKILNSKLAELVRIGLCDAHSYNRRSTLLALGKLQTLEAKEVLYEVVRGQIAVPPLSSEQEVEAGGMVAARPEMGSIPRDVSDNAAASFLLAEMGDRGILEEIERQLKVADEKDRELLIKAKSLLSP